VILPDGFGTPFEVRVSKASNFICRASVCEHLKRERRPSGEWFAFGLGAPVIRFESDGSVVIDSLESLRAADKKQKQEWQDKASESARQVTRINEVAGSIHSEADARKYLDLLWNYFSDGAPKWFVPSILERVARDEYEAVVHGRYISEERIAQSFNNFVQQIGAPDWARVTPEELRTIRDGEFKSAKAVWGDSCANIWMMPNAYHVDASGKLAPGCRAVESLKLLYTVNDLFTNVIYARERPRQGSTPSNIGEIVHQSSGPSAAQIRENRGLLTRGQQREQELRQIELNYVNQHGTRAYEKIVREMIEEVLP
jgi:hypothetical protein